MALGADFLSQKFARDVDKSKNGNRCIYVVLYALVLRLEMKEYE